MKLYRMHHKKVVRFRNKAAEFLKAYTTNTLDKPRNAFVDIRGRIVATFDQVKLSEDEVLVALEGRFVARLKAHLRKYLELGETRMEGTGYKVYFDLDGDYRPVEGEITIGRMILTSWELEAPVREEEFTLFRVQNNVPLQGVDYDEEMLLNVGDEEFVSYTKGCYLGQEIIARVHFRSRPPRKLIVKSEEKCKPEEISRMTSPVKDPLASKKSGFLFVDCAQGEV